MIALQNLINYENLHKIKNAFSDILQNQHNIFLQQMQHQQSEKRIIQKPVIMVQNNPFKFQNRKGPFENLTIETKFLDFKHIEQQQQIKMEDELQLADPQTPKFGSPEQSPNFKYNFPIENGNVQIVKQEETDSQNSSETEEIESHQQFHIKITKKIKKKTQKLEKKQQVKQSTSQSKKINKHQIKNAPTQIIQAIIRFIPNFKHQLEDLCQKVGIQYEHFNSYFSQNISTFKNLQSIRNHWIVQQQDNSFENLNNLVFREYSKIFLRDYSIRYILNGKMKYKREYLKVARYMLKHVHQPEKFITNLS